MSNDTAELGEGSSLEAVWQYYTGKFPRLADYRPHIRFALNQEFSDASARVSEGDEIAFMPPVSGGSDSTVKLVREPIDTRALVAELQRGEDGAVVTFEGVVRNNTKGRTTKFLDYECYEEMALKMMNALAADLLSKHSIGRVGLVHRLGRLQIGEASVAVIVSAPHRKAAFEAAFEGINRLKSTVPIWKKEHFADGEVWVEGEWGV